MLNKGHYDMMLEALKDCKTISNFHLFLRIFDSNVKWWKGIKINVVTLF